MDAKAYNRINNFSEVAMDISGVSTGVVVDTAVKNADVSINNEVDKKTQNVESQTETQTKDAVPQPSDNVGQNINVQV
ncbi:MAG: hypothetical protein DRQ43_08630 [Gammaproteobacteria bacterium]|nr:MAG: hypothetical protein DRQ43_08630 [Gammaproteobacteria bacterium]